MNIIIITITIIVLIAYLYTLAIPVSQKSKKFSLGSSSSPFAKLISSTRTVTWMVMVRMIIHQQVDVDDDTLVNVIMNDNNYVDHKNLTFLVLRL